MTLDKLKTGESAVIKAVGGEGALRLRFLDMGLIPKSVRQWATLLISC